MMASLNPLPIVRAAQQNTTLSAALDYAALGLSVIPLDGKRPALKTWTQYQRERADAQTIRTWSFGNVGIVCGAVSGNLVVLDLDGAAGYAAFAATFPALAQTYTVASGGGVGRHVYFYVDTLPPSVKAMNTPIGHLEVCAEGRQVVAPPSVHSATGQPYQAEQLLDILRVPNLDDLVVWVEAFKPQQEARAWQPPKISAPTGDAPINRRVIEEISRILIGQSFKPHGEWLHGRCLYPERHKHGDRSPSFGFHTVSGYGYCYLCGTMLAKEVCARLNIDPVQLGGLVEKPELPVVTHRREPPADPPRDEPSAPPLNLPDWLERYMT